MQKLEQEPQVRVKNSEKIKQYLAKYKDLIDVVMKEVDTAKSIFQNYNWFLHYTKILK
jgi:hypothetical protein